MKNKKTKQPTIQHDCQYNYPNCQKTAIGQHILKLGAVRIDKGWICGNCQQVIEQERNKQK
jgi:hypothetical protein